MYNLVSWQSLLFQIRGIGNANVDVFEKEEGKNVIILLKSKSQKVSNENFKTFFFLIIKYFFSDKRRNSSQIILGGIAQEFIVIINIGCKASNSVIFF